MVNEQVIASIRQLTEALLALDPDYFLVEVKIKPTNNVKIFVDGDKGVPVAKLVQLNRALYAQLEADGIFPDNDFSLEISSPGLDEPLKMHRQYLKNIGRKVEVTLLDGSVKEGDLVVVSEDFITLEEAPAKKKGKPAPDQKKQLDIHFTEIKHTVVCIVF
ncbi:ribosome maturation factor [Chitinophaga agrisoli]|uniref:Ribosome maturation factor RimP n=1 Tax=Chitinophaga agrisoli TaxID=2607653 RepID=A0A5B2W2K7_9BACT|nr:ribosome maturation factor [Chitinophaga agrisoli]KAA2244922.1 ribosome maturation factor [Chitinophaga agrisoli]